MFSFWKGGNLPSSPKFRAKNIEPLLEAMAYMAVAIFCTHPRPLTLGIKCAMPMKKNYDGGLVLAMMVIWKGGGKTYG